MGSRGLWGVVGLALLGGAEVAGAAEVELRGVVFEFGGKGVRVADARVCVLEAPNRRCVTTDAQGWYTLPLTLRSGEPTPVTVVLGEPGYHVMRTSTLLLDAPTVERLGPLLQTWHLQSIVGPVYTAYKDLVAVAAGQPLLAPLCQVSGTVADFTKAHHYTVDPTTGAVTVDEAAFLADTVHGFAGARVRLYAEPSAADGAWREITTHGPVYSDDRVVPMPPSLLTTTSGDGGFFFYNLPEGRYRITVEDTMAGHTAGHPVAFNGPLTVDCRCDPDARLPGVFINAGPPQVHALEGVVMSPRPEPEGRPTLPTRPPWDPRPAGAR